MSITRRCLAFRKHDVPPPARHTPSVAAAGPLRQFGAPTIAPQEPPLSEQTAPRSIEPVFRRTLHDEVVGRIRDMIIEGTLAPGARVHEGQLGEQLGISRTPLREALKYLASEGLLDLVAGRGAIVRRLSPKDVHDMLVVLSALEALAGRLVCAHATDAEIDVIRALHQRMMALYAQRQRLDYYKYNQLIHSAIVDLSGNAFLAATHNTAQSRLKRIRFLGNAAPEKWDAAVAEHVAMMEALDRRDGDALASVLSHHLDETWLRVKDSL